VPTRFRDDPAAAPSPRVRSRARVLRRQLTDPEKKLWWHLRHRLPAERTHFRRQVPLGPYVADFCCLRERLVVEVDGNQHGFDENLERDAVRTKELERQGFRVLRFSNRGVMTSIDVVLDTIFAALESGITAAGSASIPSPLRGGAGVGGAGLGSDAGISSAAARPGLPSLSRSTPAPPAPLGLRPSRPSPQGVGE
jgi:very-short-patch-repair endonuclease